MWNSRHNAAVMLRAMAVRFYDLSHGNGHGAVTTSRKANAIKHGSYNSINVKKESLKKTGYADLIYWTDKKVYVWEIKHQQSANYRSSRPSAESTGPAQLKNYIKYLTKQLRAKGDKREVVAGFAFPLEQSGPSIKADEFITVRSSSKAAGIEVYTYTKVKKIDKPSPSPFPQPNPTTVPERVPQPANPYQPAPGATQLAPLPGAETNNEWGWDWGTVTTPDTSTSGALATVAFLTALFLSPA